MTIRTRNGHDWTSRFPSIAAALLKLNVRSAVIDGEAVVLDDMGRSNFAELQADLTRRGSEAAVMYAFDLLFLDGEDLRGKPLGDRREALGLLMRPSSAVAFSDEYTGRVPTYSGSPASTGLRALCRSGSTRHIGPAGRRPG